RLVARRNLEHIASQSDDRGHEIGHPVGLEVGERQLVALVVEVAEPVELGLAGIIETRYAHLDRSSAQQLVHRSRGDHFAVVYDRHPVAYLPDLPQGMRVEETGGASGA